MKPSEKIRVMRKSEDLSQREFADIIGISHSDLTSCEHGCNPPNLEITVRIFKHPRFKKYRDWFLFDEIDLKAGQIVPALAHIGQDESGSPHSENKIG